MLMSVIRIMTNFNIDLEFPAAPFQRRLLAWLIDIVILFIYGRVGGELISSIPEDMSRKLILVVFILFVLPFFTYHLLCEIFMNGQSFGKKITGIRVVNENGGQPSISQFVIRWIIRTSDLVAVILILVALEAAQSGQSMDIAWKLGIPLALFLTDVVLVNTSKKNQRLGDMLAHTLLIRTVQKHSITDTVFLDLDTGYVPSFPQVMQLSDRDINSLKGIIDTARLRGDYNLAEMASEKIKNHLQIQTTLSPFDFLEILLKDYNYLSTH